MRASQPLFRACGVGAGCVTVLDCTAGLLGDALLLAQRGMTVTAYERNPEMAARQREMLESLRDAAAAGEGGEFDGPTLARVTLVEADAREALRAIAERGGGFPDVVYIDPMHPERKKGLSAKEMREVREIVGVDEDAGELLAWGLLAAGRRVVVKWPRVGPGLETKMPAWALQRFRGLKPAATLGGRGTRLDVFTPRRRE